MAAWIAIPAIIALDWTDQTGKRFTVQRLVGAVTHIYHFYIHNDGNLNYVKSIDGGSTWTAPITVASSRDYMDFGIWFDQWTPGDTTGTLVHIIALSTTDNKYYYHVLDISNDTLATNDNTEIITTTANTPILAGSCNIVKQNNNDLFVGCISSTPAGVHFLQSTTAGASWVDKTNDGTVDMATIINDDDDDILLIPLKTNNDILLIWSDESTDNFNYRVWNNSTGLWDASDTLIIASTGLFKAAGFSHMMAATVDKSTGDIDLVISPVRALQDLAQNLSGINHYKFTDSTHVMGTPNIVLEHIEYGFTFGDLTAVCICRDQVKGHLFLAFTFGRSNITTKFAFCVSSDDGLTWGNPIDFDDRNFLDDFKLVYMAISKNALAEPWVMAGPLDDNSFLYYNDQFILKHQSVKGNVVDKDDLPISGADVEVLRDNPKVRITHSRGARQLSFGHVKSDANGDYEVCVIDNDNTNPEYHAIGDKDGATEAADAADMSHRIKATDL